MRRLISYLFFAAIVLSFEQCRHPLENTPPIIKRIMAEPDSVFPGDTVKLTFEYTDDEGDSIDVKWTVRTGILITDPVSGIQKWVAPKFPGDYYVQLRISELTDSLADVDIVRISVAERPGTFTDPRDGHAYKWVKIGDQIWMAENLAFLPWTTSMLGDSSGYYVWGYSNGSTVEPKQDSNYKKYGVLYGHESARRACPKGWHLSTDEEWKALEISQGMDPAIANLYNRFDLSKSVAKSLMSNFLWSGNNSSGFCAVPGGSISYYTRPRYESWNFTGVGENAVYFSPAYNSNLCRVIFDYDLGGSSSVGINRRDINDLEGFSVRCVKDN